MTISKYKHIMLMFSLMLFSIVSYSQKQQKPILSQSINLSTSKEYSQLEIIDEIQKQTGVSFSYKSKLLSQAKTQKYAGSISIETALKSALVGTNLDFVVINGVVVIKTTKEISKIIKRTIEKNPDASIEYSAPPPKDEPVASKKVIISGQILGSVSDEVVINALISIESLGIQVFSNEFGFFSISVPEGEYTVKVQHDNSYVSEFTINTKEKTQYDLAITEKQTVLSSKTATVIETKNAYETTTLLHAQVNTVKKSSTFGFVDPFKEIERLPGVQEISDISSNYIVRGGTQAQNLVLYDDAPIFNPTHMFGLYSIFVPNSINNMKLYKQYTPIEYGGKLSSVLDIRSRDGNKKNVGFYNEVGLYASTISLETPIVKDYASLIVSLRGSNLKILQNQALLDTSGNSLYKFHDMNAKVSFNLGKRHSCFASFYNGEDSYNKSLIASGAEGVLIQNSLGSFGWNFIVSPRLFTNTTLYYSVYDFDFYLSSKAIDYWTSNIGTAGFKYNATFFMNNSNTLKYGIDAVAYDFKPGDYQLEVNGVNSIVEFVSRSKMQVVSWYSNHEHVFNKKLVLHYGVRVPYSQNVGAAKYYVFNQIDYTVEDSLEYLDGEAFNKSWNVEPRLLYTYQIIPKLSLRTSYTKNIQYIHQIINSENQFTLLNVWLPTSPTLKPEIARQFNIGTQYTPLLGKIVMSFDVYIKRMQNQLLYKDHARMLTNRYLEGELRFGKSRAYGFEALFEYNNDKFSTWVSYTYARSFTQSELVNNGETFSTIADRPHDFSFDIIWKPIKRLHVNMLWKYTSGMPFTSPTSFYVYQGKNVPIYASVNNDRLPAYHRMDLSVQYRLNKKDRRAAHVLSFGILNVYGRKNPMQINFGQIISEDNTNINASVSGTQDLVTTATISEIQIIPTISYAVTFN